jgi:hypothetical protein
MQGMFFFQMPRQIDGTAIKKHASPRSGGLCLSEQRTSYAPWAAYLVFVKKVAMGKVMPPALQRSHNCHSTNVPHSFISTIINAI